MSSYSDMSSYPSDGIPTLTQRAEADIPTLDTPAAPVIPEAVLRAALHIEIEQLVKSAADEAAELLRKRLESELPALLAQVIARVRPG